MKKKEILLKHVSYIFKNYLFGLAVFFILRVLFLLANLKFLDGISRRDLFSLLPKAFFFGLRFDTVILCYILVLPSIFLIVFSFFPKLKFNIYKYINFFVCIFFSILFLISLIDIPYYKQFLERFSVEAFEWMDTPMIVLKMIITDKTNILFFIILVILFLLLFFYYKKVLKNFQLYDEKKGSKAKLITTSIILSFFLFLGARGRIAFKSPIRVGTAFFSNYSFINKLGLNPSFTLIKSILEKGKGDVLLIEDEFAIDYIKKYFETNDGKYPLKRKKIFSGEEKKYNVVLIIVESMTAMNLEKHGGKKSLTPFLNSIVKKSLFFNNFYSSGIHTYNGIYSCLTSFPTVLKKHSMKGVVIPKYNGISDILKSKGYKTLFFINHDSEFDNIGGFVKNNNFDLIVSQKDYPREKIVSSLGVGDDFMFEYSIGKISKQKNPFFACFMTASNHGPYKIPEYANFTPKCKEIKKQLIEYTDWSLRKFIELAKKETWFDNTIFVITGDHGRSDNTPYEVSFAYHRVPLFFYAPKIIEPKEKNNLGGQIDIFPTIMHFLNLSYVNNTYGVDLLDEGRQYVFFTNNENIACLNEEYLYVFNSNKKDKLYKYKNLLTKNCIEENKKLAKDMKNYVFSMLQSSQFLIKNKKTYYKE